MWGVQNKKGEILSIHTQERDAKTQKDRIKVQDVVLVEDTEENLVQNFKQD